MTDLEICQHLQILYTLKPGGSTGPFDIVLHEEEDYGVNVGIRKTPSFFFLGFRGSITPEDWGRDAISFLPEKFNGVEVPLGFSMGMGRAIEKIKGIVGTVPVVIGGHSLGAAHAALAYHWWSYDLIEKVTLFGCPNPGLETVPDDKITNYRNGKDYVTDVPPWPWKPIVEFTQINGGHNQTPGLFMYHHIDYYEKGLKRLSRGNP